MKWKKSELIIAGLIAVAGIVAIIALGSIFLEYAGGNAAYSKLEEYVFLPDDQPAVAPEAGNGQNTDSKQVKENEAQAGSQTGSQAADSTSGNYVYYGQSPQVDFASLSAQNKDVVGWIYGPDTVISYPIVQGTDNEFYLTHMFNGEKNKCGSIFMDSLNEEDFSNANSILHGHHMRNGSMFAGLMKYESQSYYDSHPIMWLVTPEKSYIVEIFTGFVTSSDSDVWQLEFATNEEYQSWLDKMEGNSVFKSDVEPDTDDRILTLATCSYEYDDARFVVMGILREQTE